MTQSNHYSRRQQPSRASTKDSWLTIDWGDRPPPSHLHGILDRIAGHILRDPKLVEQGKNEWRKASAMARDRKRRAARRQNGGRTSSSGNKVRGSGSGKSTPQKKSGFLGSLFSSSSTGGSSDKNKKKSSSSSRPVRSGTLRRAMTTPGKQHSSSSVPQVRRRATDGARRRA